MFGLGLPELIVLFAVTGIILMIPMIFFLISLQKALSACSYDSRTMSPPLVWLLFIPLFNFVWSFVVVNALSNSLHNELVKRHIAESSAPGRGVGLAWSILSVLSIIPLVGILTGLAAFICWIAYWVSVSGYSAKLRAIPYWSGVQTQNPPG
jgi:hypothetical protein